MLKKPAYSKVNKIEFYVLGSEENYKDRAVSVQTKDLFKGDIPVMGGCYDPAMGTTDYSWNCTTCGNSKSINNATKSRCPGHSGALELKYPVKSPLFRDEIIKWLKVVCFRCGRLVVTPMEAPPTNKTLGEYVKLAKPVSICPWADCKAPKLNVVKDKIRPIVFYIEIKEKGSKKIELYNHHIKEILKRVNEDTLKLLGKSAKSHPSNYILDIVRVPPNTIRPDIRKIGGSRSNNSDTTALFKNIVEINDVLPNDIPNDEEITSRLNETYFNLDFTYYTAIKGTPVSKGKIRMVTTTNKTPSSIATRIPKKVGRIRGNLMGKRVWYMMRSVIGGDESLAVDEIGIPIALLKSIQMPETVRIYNFERLNVFFKNKRNIYPGCSGIYKKGSNKLHKIEHLDPTYELQEGDIVMRDMMEGDYIGFNRQPSLLFGQMGAHRIVPMEKSNTIRLSVSACMPYNADFDGDAANGIVAQNIQALVEYLFTSWMGRWFISYQNHSPYAGCFQDSLIGSAEITRSDVKMDKWHIMQIFSTMVPEDESGFSFSKSNYTGREAISMFIPKINYPKKKSSIYLPQYAPYVKYDEDEVYVQINRGQLISGTLDKSTTGQGVMGSIFHVINNEYGAKKALETIHNFHQITSRFFLWKGYTISIEDMIISSEAMRKIKGHIASMRQEADEISEKLNNRELIAPLGMDLIEYYESRIANALEPGDGFIKPIISDMDFRNNGLIRLIFTGSKGSKLNMTHINASCGLMTTGGNFPKKSFGRRTGVYFLQGETSPESMGFIEQSYREGISPEVFSFAASDARYSSINLELSTSVSGHQGRISIKNLESILVNNLRQSAKGANVIQLIYADSGVDPRKTEAVKFLTAMLSDEQMLNEYKANTKMFNKAYHNKAVEEMLDDEYEQLLKDREFYRKVFMWSENNNLGKFLMDNTQQMPVNPFRIIEDVLYNYEDIQASLDKTQKILDPVMTIKKVRSLCNSLAYAYFNSMYEKQKRKVPEVYARATDLLAVLIRTYLCTANLSKKGINNFHLDIIINKIKMIFKNSLIDYGAAVGMIAAQCLSQPLTQFVIDSKHNRGSGGKSTTLNALERFKEILGAKATEDLKMPSMFIMVKEEYRKNKLSVQEIANHIEMMSLERFIISERLFYEKYGNPEHSDFKHEEKMIKDFERKNIGLQVPNDISKWCVRYEINKEELLINSMKLDTIIAKLQLKYPEIHLVYTPETANHIIIRAYITHSMIKIPSSGFSEALIIELVKKISKTIIRGIPRITYTEVVDIAKSEIKSDGSVETIKIYGISTLGTNLEEVLDNPYVDKYLTQTNSITEYEDMYGIEAARQKISYEIAKTFSGGAIKEHIDIFSSEMTYSGRLSSIQKTGLQIREAKNVTLRLSFQSPIQVIENAAVNNITDEISGISGPLINGQSPDLGTCYNDVLINESFVESQMKSSKINIQDEL
jgi:DNA-directed RNA polymerase beta' subunit